MTAHEERAEPVADRRSRLGTGSARSTLLTILGEFVHPRGDGVWTATLLAALATLGVEEKAARQALTRTAADRVLESTRHGRRVLWRLTPEGTDLLAEGTRHIYGFLRDRHDWDGRWLVLSVAIPESRRRLRHRLRTRLTWLGMGTPSPGLWVSPDPAAASAVHDAVVDLGVADRAFAWVGPITDTGDERLLLTQAWDLDDVEHRYLQFVDEFAIREPVTDADAFAAQVQLIQAWRRFPFLDPDLPPELLDHDWPGPRATDAFHDCHRRWDEAAQRAWETFVALGGPLP